MDETRRLAEHVVAIRNADVPLPVLDRTKMLVLDWLGNAVRAQYDADSSGPISRTVHELAAGSTGRTTAIGHVEKYPAHYSALLNATYAHSLDFDDTHAGGSVHPGAPSIAAALAAAEDERSDGPTFLAAVIAAYEVSCRLSKALTPSAHYSRGFHPTATTGSFAAAAAAAVVQGVETPVLESAFGLCGSMASGSLQFLADGAWNKRVHVGLAAHNGLVAARLAGNGVIGAAAALEGDRGFLKGYSDNARPAAVTDGFFETWEIAETAIKPYPSCRLTHAAIESILGLVADNAFTPEEIEGVTVGLSQKAVELVGSPAVRKRDPWNVVDGQFSMHWTAAVAVLRGHVAWADYDSLRDPEVLEFARKVEVEVDPAVEAVYPDRMGCRVTIRARGGSHERVNMEPLGEPGTSLGWKDVTSKFEGLVIERLDSQTCSAVVSAVRNLETCDDITQLSGLLSP